MNTVSFFRDARVGLPVAASPSDTRDTLRRRFDGYRDALAQLDVGSGLSKQIGGARGEVDKLCAVIIESLDHAYSGRRMRAADHLQAGLTALGGLFKRLCDAPGTEWKDALDRMYRIRQFDDGEYATSAGDLFHIPFDRRHMVRPYRFSIEGHPCLYLGRTLYSCWEELGRPSLDRSYFSVFSLNPDERHRLLDLSLRPGSVAQIAENVEAGTYPWTRYEGFVVSYAACWPLLAACSMRAQNRRAPFVPEYIVPQMVLDYIRNDGNLLGVCYSSTRVNTSDDYPYLSWNFVFPARGNSPTGYCKELSKLFTMSQPVNRVSLHGRAPSARDKQMHFAALIELIPGVPEYYYDTYFGDLESRCHGLKLAPPA